MLGDTGSSSDVDGPPHLCAVLEDSTVFVQQRQILGPMVVLNKEAATHHTGFAMFPSPLFSVCRTFSLLCPTLAAPTHFYLLNRPRQARRKCISSLSRTVWPVVQHQHHAVCFAFQDRCVTTNNFEVCLPCMN